MTSVILVMKCDSQKEGMAYLKDVIHIIIYYKYIRQPYVYGTVHHLYS